MAASESQELVFTEVKTGKGNIAVQATAGSGKTYTLLEVLKLIPRLKKSIFLSFANSIVQELKDRVPPHVKAKTLHSLGYAFLRSRFPHVELDEKKYFKLALEQFEKKNKDVYKKCFVIQDICSYARLTLTPFEEVAIRELCDKYDLDGTPECILVATIILQENTKLRGIHRIDFVDMIYFAAVFPDLVTETYDYVFLDEAQDMNECQTALVEHIIRPKVGRLVFVGDENQSIYSFMGADIESFKKLEVKFGSKRMQLTVTYRCAKEIVKLAQSVYPDAIQAHPDSPDGIVRRGELNEAVAGDMVICRNTKPLVSAFFEYVKAGKKAYVQGKDMEKGLKALAESVEGATTNSVEFNISQKLEAFAVELENDGVKDPFNNPKYVALSEKCDILLLILSKCNLAHELVPKITEIFHEDKKAIRLLTAHRSKGLENHRVFFIEIFNNKKLLPSDYAVLPWQKIQENNLLFVVYTRAKFEFVFVEHRN